MHPYLPVWLALHAVPLGSAAIQVAAAGAALARGHRAAAGVLLASAGAVVSWLGPGFVALWRGGALAAPGLAEDVGRVAPFLALAALAALGPRTAAPPLTTRSLLALALGLWGPPALLATIAIVATGRLEAPRGAWLGAGIAAIAFVRVLEHGRFVVRSVLAVALGLGQDHALLAAGAGTALVAAAGWVAVVTWALGHLHRDPRRPGMATAAGTRGSA